MKKSAIVGAVVCSVACAGCSVRVADFTLLSTRNVELTRAGEFERGAQRVKGSDSGGVFLLFPLGEPNIETAVDQALEATPGAVALADGVITYDWFMIPLLVYSITYKIEGTPVIDPAMTSAKPPLRSAVSNQGLATDEKPVPQQRKAEALEAPVYEGKPVGRRIEIR